jgi:uncharacterized membrane protein YebE (DUF533 family)
MAFHPEIFIAAATTSDVVVKPLEGDAAGASLALFLLVVIAASWIGLRTFVRTLRARKAERTLGTSFAEFAVEALVNAAKIDGRVNDDERRAVAAAISDLAGAARAAETDKAFASARLSKEELVAYLGTRSRAFSRDQKVALLKALLSVFVADGRFDATEHAALVDYTAAIGFDRQSAPGLLQGLTRDFARGNIT